MSSISELQKKIRNATQLRITSSGDDSDDELLNMSSYSGVVEYFPEELVITLKAGTSIKEAKQVLAKNNQAFSFFVDDSDQSIGSIYSTSGAELSDSVLGIQIINGKGDLLNFGGQVMKNVAGYDVSRLLVGSLGKLAVITEVSFKVLPEQVFNRLEQKQLKKKTESPIKSEIEKKLKSVFDPYGVFI
jgi:glycolate oxidase FAD binding subunit